MWASSGQLLPVRMEASKRIEAAHCLSRQGDSLCSLFPTDRWQVRSSALFVPTSCHQLAMFITSAQRKRNYLAADLCYDIYLHGGREEKNSPVTEKPDKYPVFLHQGRRMSQQRISCGLTSMHANPPFSEAEVSSHNCYGK